MRPQSRTSARLTSPNATCTLTLMSLTGYLLHLPLLRSSHHGAGAGYSAWAGMCLLYVSVATALVGLVELKAKGARG